MEMPVVLREALEAEVVGIPVKGLSEATTGLSERYRDAAATGAGYFRSEADFAAYAASRMPATYAAVRAALVQVRESMPDWTPGTVLDVGAGPGTASWAALDVWPGIREVTLLERESGMIGLGGRLADSSPDTALREANWIKADLMGGWETGPHDLVVASYSLNELPETRALEIVKRLWGLTEGALVIVEPGTPVGYGRIKAYRSALTSEGAGVVAPCPHSAECPMDDGDWCHFAQRIPRSRLHRQLKSGDLGYEDEKYSYAAFARVVGKPASARVLRHPKVTKGYVLYTACTPSGVAEATVARRDKEAYKAAKDLEWGSPIGD